MNLTTWRTDTYYVIGETIILYGETYTCYVSHKSNMFGEDLHDHGYWYHPRTGPYRTDLPNKNKMDEL